MPEQTYPNKCCQCGACCIFQTCPIGRWTYKVSNKHARCPGLRFDGDVAICKPFEDREAVCKALNLPTQELYEAFGIGAGCCILAHWFKDGVDYNFADLPDEVKIESVRQIRKSYGI